MKELLEVLAKHLVDSPEQVKVTEREDEDVLVLELSVASEDVGKIIGKQGRIAKAIRTFIKSAAGRENRKVVVKIL